MTVTYQISDKRGDAILLVKAEGEPGDELYSAFAAAVQDAGLDAGLNSFGTALVQAVTNAQPLTVPPIQAIQQQPQQPWGQPPVPPFQPQVPAVAAPPTVQAADPSTPSCQHGPKTYKSGQTNGRNWAFWGCNAASNDPTKCDKEWVR